MQKVGVGGKGGDPRWRAKEHDGGCYHRRRVGKLETSEERTVSSVTRSAAPAGRLHDGLPACGVPYLGSPQRQIRAQAGDCWHQSTTPCARQGRQNGHSMARRGTHLVTLRRARRAGEGV